MKIARSKEILSRKFNCLNIIISIILAYILCIVTYKLFYPVCVYSNLHDFYVGESIYLNHNKQFDINLIYLYIAYFFAIYVIPKPKIKNVEFNFSKLTTYKPFIIAITVTIAIYYGIILIGNLIGFSFPEHPDTHHYGEKSATYFVHKTFQMEYYEDIMLVHGFLDIFPSFIKKATLYKRNL